MEKIKTISGPIFNLNYTDSPIKTEEGWILNFTMIDDSQMVFIKLIDFYQPEELISLSFEPEAALEQFSKPDALQEILCNYTSGDYVETTFAEIEMKSGDRNFVENHLMSIRKINVPEVAYGDYQTQLRRKTVPPKGLDLKYVLSCIA